jgi:Tol biopolymer transport system component
VPEWLAAVTHRALARLPADRFPNAGSLKEQLLEASVGNYHAMTHARRSRRPLHPSVAAAGGIALAAGLALGWLLFDDPSAEPRPTYVTASLPEGVRLRPALDTDLDRSVAISPDGREVVFVGEHDGHRLYRLSLNAPGGIEAIPGTEGGRSPFFSSTGAWIGFVSGTSLMKVPSGGGAPTELASVSGFRGGAWSLDDDYVYYAPSISVGLLRVPANGGAPEEITRPAFDGIDDSHLFPIVLPNGDLLFTSCCGDVRTFILEGADPGGTPRPLLQGGGAQYVPSGHLVFMQRENVMLASYDPGTRERGPPEPVLEGTVTGNEMYAGIAVSSTGTLAYLAGRSEFERPLVRIRPDGASDSMPVPPASHVFPIHFSPDGTRLLYTSYEDASHDVFAYDVGSGRQPRRLTTHPSTDYSQIWGPGPSRFTFTSTRGGGRQVYTQDVASTSEPELLIESELGKWPLSWTADGAWLLYSVNDPETGEDLWLYSAERDSTWAFLTGAYNEYPAAFAPAGDWLAYARDDVGQRKEIWAMPFPDGVACPISIGGGTYPIWSRDGDRLYYMKRDTHMLAEAGGGDICRARPRPHVVGLNTVWGLAPDESYVVTVSPPPPLELRLIISWTAELAGRARE